MITGNDDISLKVIDEFTLGKTIVQSIDINIKRDTLSKMLLALAEKRKNVDEVKIQLKYSMQTLKEKRKK